MSTVERSKPIECHGTSFALWCALTLILGIALVYAVTNQLQAQWSPSSDVSPSLAPAELRQELTIPSAAVRAALIAHSALGDGDGVAFLGVVSLGVVSCVLYFLGRLGARRALQWFVGLGVAAIAVQSVALVVLSRQGMMDLGTTIGAYPLDWNDLAVFAAELLPLFLALLILRAPRGQRDGGLGARAASAKQQRHPER